MKNKACLIFHLFLFVCIANAQVIVNLPHQKADNIKWIGEEKAFFSKRWNSEVVTNVSKPSIQIFSPNQEINTGTCVIIAPGGGLYALSMNNEGTLVADWLVKKGITAVILKYRLVPTYTDDGIKEYQKLSKENRSLLHENVQKTMPYSVSDALSAISYVRKNASKLNINPNKIGLMGFSAGGAVTVGASYNYTTINRPDFLVPVYPWLTEYPVREPQKDAPPLFIVCASNDPLKLALESTNLYKSWKAADLNVALHMYAKGGHGFGLKTKGLPSDTWIDRFYEWALNEKLITTNN
ncbi:alpha/beta hydrolase [Wenyingzhuangia sp. 1_MG-2023]|nr:alpha/beta hydrolase [Wenyingzhuangia sp. 1_MG-2023]